MIHKIPTTRKQFKMAVDPQTRTINNLVTLIMHV